MTRFHASINAPSTVTVVDTEEDVEIVLNVDDLPVMDGVDLSGDEDVVRAEAVENLYEILAASLRERGYVVRPGDLFVNTDRISIFFLPQEEQC